MSNFNKLYEILKELGFEDENDIKYYMAPRPNKISAWTGEDCSAIIIGVENTYVDFIFDENMKFDRIRIGGGCRYTEPI